MTRMFIVKMYVCDIKKLTKKKYLNLECVKLKKTENKTNANFL